MKAKLSPASRPYWFVDAKWICGILFTISLVISLVLMVAVQLTDDRWGPKIAALTVGSLFVRGDSAVDIDEARAAIRKQGGSIHPIPNMPEITITEKDLELSVTDIKLKVFLPLTTMLYKDGIDVTAERYAKTPEEKAKFKNDASLLQVFTRSTHEFLSQRLLIFVSLSALLLLGVVYFSAGWGRLANAGLLLVASSLPGSLVALLLEHPPKNGDGGLGFLPRDIASNVGAAIGQTCYWITICGLVLLIVALVGKIVAKCVRKKAVRASDG